MLKIYNTLSGRKEEFKPMDGNKVKMYACGITVSGDAHVGHIYQALIYDIIRKYLVKSGYDVTYARNYTDVDDKIINKANELHVKADAYAAEMIEKIDALMKEYQIDEPNVWLKATCNIGNIIEFIKKLIEKNHAYATSKGDVYFAVDSFSGYGKLSHRNLEDALNGVRVENDEQKKNALDFALWKSAKEGEIFWKSPWGDGRPGWHIECSAMNMAAFGEQIDIHGGGRDLIFPHHENEIAQTEALTGKQFAKYWIHNGLIKVNGQKMSKSLGNSLLGADLIAKYHREVIKFALLETNYRNDINLTDELFSEAQKHVLDFYGVYKSLADKGAALRGEYKSIDDEFNEAMDDDFNTAKALSNLFKYFKSAKAALNGNIDEAAAILNQIKNTYSLLGLFKDEPSAVLKDESKEEIPAEVFELVEKRKQAKAEKNWAEADRIRDEILKLGYTVKDTKDGAVVEKA